MKLMDSKEAIILNHYCKVIKERKFDEYDILGFLIFIRRHIQNDFPSIREFSDLIAHRRRDRGIAARAIQGAKRNGYQAKGNSTGLLGYHGICPEQWEREWKHLLNIIRVEYSHTLLLELSICIYSLAQNTEYHFDDIGAKMELFMFSDGYLALSTTECSKESPYVCFARIGPFDLKTGNQGFPIYNPVETFRENGILHLREISGNIII